MHNKNYTNKIVKYYVYYFICIVFGGILFSIAMMIADGCSSLSSVYPSAQTLELFTYYVRYYFSFGISLAVSLR
jgi:hypothetical protein